MSLCFAWLSLLLTGPAAAQETGSANEGLVVDGLGLPDSRPALSVRADAQAITLNPGLLGLVEMAELDVEMAARMERDAGVGLFAAIPITSFFGLGFATQWQRASSDEVFARNYQLGAGLSLADRLGLGVRYSFFGSEESLDIDRFSSLDLGLTLRLIPALVLSMVVEHLDTPRFRGEWLDPILHVGLGSVVLDGALKLDLSYSDGLAQIPDGRAQGTVMVSAADGVELFADGSYDELESRWGGGLELDFGNWGFSLGAHGRTPAVGSTEFDGLSFGLSVRPTHTSTVFESSQRWVRLVIPGSADERAARTLFGPAGTSFAQLLLTLQTLAKDPRYDGVVLEIGGLGYGYAQLFELRDAVQEVRAAGKTVVAYLGDGSTRSYALGSVCNAVYLSPGQSLSVTGLSTSLTFYARGLRFLGVEPEFVKIDEYKSAPDAYLREMASDEQLEQMDDYLEGIFEQVIGAIAQSRNLDASLVRGAINTMPMRPSEARAMGLLDGSVYSDELATRIATDLGLSSVPAVESEYQPPRPREETWTAKSRIAVIYVDGPIIMGNSVEVPISGAMATGSDTIIQLLDWAGASRSVEGVVLRIDSPGGSAHASDLINRAVAKLAEKKPVVVSMGNVAASGGYYIAAPATRIFADPLTVTGSIGIFAGKFNVKGLMAWLGVGHLTLKKGDFSDIFSPMTSWSDETRAQITDEMTTLYEEFIDRVVTGRHLDPSVAKSVGDGRVWTGSTALQKGLVDELGGLTDAIDSVRIARGLDADSLEVLHLPQRSPLSAYAVALPIDLFSVSNDDIPALETRTLDVPPLFAALAGRFPELWLYEEGEMLMMLPFGFGVD